MKKLETLWPQPTGSLNGSEDLMMSHQVSRAHYATEWARFLFGQYRRGDANDPDTYVASVAAILADYPAETIRYVTDPRTGIAANPINPNWTGLPDIADVKRACENYYGPSRRSAEREAAISAGRHHGGRQDEPPDYLLVGCAGGTRVAGRTVRCNHDGVLDVSSYSDDARITIHLSNRIAKRHVCSSIERQEEEYGNGKGEKGAAVHALGSAWQACAAGYAETT